MEQDPRPLDPLVTRLAPFLPSGYRVAFHLTGDAERAEDLVARAVRLTVEDRPGLGRRGRDDLKLRFLRLLVAAVDAEAPGVEGVPDVRPGPNGTRSAAAARWEPLAEFVRRASLGQLHEALQGLRPHCRAACVLHFSEGLSYRDLAAVLGGTVEAVRTCLHRGRAELRERLKDLAERPDQAWGEARPA